MNEEKVIILFDCGLTCYGCGTWSDLVSVHTGENLFRISSLQVVIFCCSHM